ncbi:MAG: MFS transporter [Candidatus Ornithospirochaeta sp.]|nr:MFS transporter [Sphaerochaetaceae bacterium]MDY5524490.1 MFS transporter [Candidatus Ornithospirochaeta sp.]
MKKENTNPLWTRDFTIITLGSVVSMVGNSLSGFAMSLMVLDYTSSSLFYAIYIMVFTLPQLIVPVFSGAILDRFSRKKTIYTLDYISSILYLTVGLLLFNGWFNYPLFALFVFILGSIQSIYQVAYQSFYPMLITEGNFSKAYSVASMLESVTVFIVPVSTLVYNVFGIGPLMLANALCFFIAATVETRIKTEEKYVEEQKATEEKNKIHQMLSDTKKGFEYLWQEKGLFFIALYFLFSSISGGASNVIYLPYMKANFAHGEYYYLLFGGFMMLGRVITSSWHYRNKLPVNKKFLITFIVYTTLSLINGALLYLPLALMFILGFIQGCMGVTSYTIRISATQSYVPDEKKGRFNGAFNMLSVLGCLIGEGIAGVLSELMDMRLVVVLVEVVVFASAVLIMGGGRKSVAPIYNREQ